MSATLTPPGDHDERMLGRVEQAAERLELAAQQQARGRRQQVRDALGRGVRAVRGAEGVVDVGVGERARGRPRRPGSLAVSPAWKRTFSSSSTSPSRSSRDGVLRDLADAVARERDRGAEQLGEPLAHGRERGGRVGRALRPPEVRAEDHARAGLAQRRDRRQRRADARVVADHAVLDRDVEVDAAEHAPAGELQRVQAARERAGHRTLVIRSTSRFEKPHSLSYQEMTLAWRPCAIVSLESKIDENGIADDVLRDDLVLGVGEDALHAAGVGAWP